MLIRFRMSVQIEAIWGRSKEIHDIVTISSFLSRRCYTLIFLIEIKNLNEFDYHRSRNEKALHERFFHHHKISSSNDKKHHGRLHIE